MMYVFMIIQFYLVVIFFYFCVWLQEPNLIVIPLQGHEKEALNLMSAYLPKDSSSTGQYAEGGGLYALGG